MTDDDKPNPLDDVRKGLGLLFRAAKTAAKKLPTKNIEEVVITGAREVGRAVENVASTIEKQVFKKDEGAKPEDAPAASDKGEEAPASDDKKEPPPGPRVD